MLIVFIRLGAGYELVFYIYYNRASLCYYVPLPPLFVVAVVPMVRLCPSDVIFGPPVFPSSWFCDALTRTSGGLLKFGFCCCWWCCMMLAKAVEDMLPVGGETLFKDERVCHKLRHFIDRLTSCSPCIFALFFLCVEIHFLRNIPKKFLILGLKIFKFKNKTSFWSILH